VLELLARRARFGLLRTALTWEAAVNETVAAYSNAETGLHALLCECYQEIAAFYFELGEVRLNPSICLRLHCCC
jgi:hypothetical protein